MRLKALETFILAELHLGHHSEVIVELRRLADTHPLRERLQALHMLALYREGRQAEALAVYRHARGVLADEVGISPSAELNLMHQRILNSDPMLAATGVTRHGGGGEYLPTPPCC
jgi:DNA-binding SARP family transcriptional activator